MCLAAVAWHGMAWHGSHARARSSRFKPHSVGSKKRWKNGKNKKKAAYTTVPLFARSHAHTSCRFSSRPSARLTHRYRRYRHTNAETVFPILYSMSCSHAHGMENGEWQRIWWGQISKKGCRMPVYDQFARVH